MAKTKDIMQGHYQKHLIMDRKGNLISKKKRINDSKLIEELLSSKSKLKLTLRQYRFLMKMRAIDTCTPNQRGFIEELSKKQKSCE